MRSHTDTHFKTSFAANIFRQKYALWEGDDWWLLADRLVDDVCGGFQGKGDPLLSVSERQQLTRYITDMKFIPGGRYLYYAGRPFHGWNNCFLLKGEEDTREEWGALLKRVSNCLMTGGGIGVDYSVFRPRGAKLGRTGGVASGPLPLMRSINEVGRNVQQGGARRSAIYASLNWRHDDAQEFLQAKDWADMPVGKSGYSLKDAKQHDFNFPAPLDMTNISLNYDDAFLEAGMPETFLQNVAQACRSGEPGLSFNFGKQERETLRNAPVSADTWVLTDNGYVQINDVVGIPITVWTGKQWATTTFNKTAENVSVIGVCMTGGRIIKAEPSHEFLVERWRGAGVQRKLVSIDKVPASELKIGDTLHVSLVDASPLTHEDPYSYTLGFLYGDGTFNRYGGKSELTLCVPEKKACFSKMLQSSVRYVVDPDSRGYMRIHFNADFKGYNKEECPQFTSAAQIQNFVAGLFDADGNWDSRKHRVRLSSVRYEFLAGVRRLLESVGIRSNINKGSKCQFSGNPSYMLVIVAEDVTKFAETIPTHRLKVIPFKPYRTFQIKVIGLDQDLPLEDVYCCDVKVPEHSFCAEGVIISNCCEVVSEDDSDVCNLGSINLGNVESPEELEQIVELATKFLLCGTLRATLPYEKVAKVRTKNRRLGLGLMGIHEWLLKRKHPYAVVPELHAWLAIYRDRSNAVSKSFADALGVSRPVACRAIAPTGTIGIMASTTTGIEPLYAVAYKRRYITKGSVWKYEYVVDATAAHIIEEYGLDPNDIETAASLAPTPERRIKFQADIQDYVDMAISSTINLPPYGSDHNNADTVPVMAALLQKYAPRLRGFTCYPDGARGGQPLTLVDYETARRDQGVVFEENVACKDGVCGI